MSTLTLATGEKRPFEQYNSVPVETLQNDPDVPLYSAESADGTFYLRKKKRKVSSPEGGSGNSSSGGGYFGIPIHDLLINIAKTESSSAMSSVEQSVRNPEPLQTAPQLMLAERYRPAKWTDFLGSESCHKQILWWVKRWHENDGTAKKILLIHGPPGVGKTSVARMVAEKQGYNVLEINASENRGGPELEEQISRATSASRSVMSTKPILVIADEIEGAAENGLIRTLVKLATGTGSREMHRPIIAICNNAYASSLRLLRPHCQLVRYGAISHDEIVNRLKEICSLENMKVPTHLLADISNVASGDMRSALNMLQYGVGDGDGLKENYNKDASLSWMSLASRVFRVSKHQTRKQEMEDILYQSENCGSIDKVVAGCFSMYLDMHYSDDSRHRRPVIMSDWLAFHDEMNQAIYTKQHSALAGYLPAVVGEFHNLFSSPANRVDGDSRPVTDYELMMQQRENNTLVSSIQSNMTESLGQIFTREMMVLELAPYFMTLVNPERAMDTASYKQRIAHAVDLCVDIGLRLDKVRFSVDEGVRNNVLAYKIEPPIDQIAFIDDNERQKAAGGTFIVREKIFKELSTRPFQQHKKGTFYKVSSEVKNNASLNKEPDQAPTARKQQTSFFGSSTQSEGMANANEDKLRVWVQYFEGFSNAVRKDATWKDLW